MDTTTVRDSLPKVSTHPETATGDPFVAAGHDRARDHDRPHGCYDGVVYIGHMDVDPETGDELQVVDRVPCKRCNPR